MNPSAHKALIPSSGWPMWPSQGLSGIYSNLLILAVRMGGFDNFSYFPARSFLPQQNYSFFTWESSSVVATCAIYWMLFLHRHLGLLLSRGCNPWAEIFSGLGEPTAQSLLGLYVFGNLHHRNAWTLPEGFWKAAMITWHHLSFPAPFPTLHEG